MKRFILPIILLAALAVIVLTSNYLDKEDFIAGDIFKKETSKQDAERPETEEKTNVVLDMPKLPDGADEETVLTGEYFEITLPAGWHDMPNHPEVLLLAVDPQGGVIKGAEDAKFGTNFSIKYDDLERYEKDYTVQEYANEIKTGLTQSLPNIKYTYEEKTTFNGQEAFLIECESVQGENSFKTLLIFIKKDNYLWALSFNTFQDSWQTYRDLFYQTIDSFKLIH